MTAAPHILLLGAGDIAQRIAQRQLGQGARVTAVARTAATLADAAAIGCQTLPADLASADLTLPAADAIYYCAAPAAEGAADATLINALSAITLPPKLGLLYLSTTGVYGDCQGRWITEAEPLKPQTARGRRRMAAERSVVAWAAAHSARALRLRIPGIYGPSRLPSARLQAGTPILAVADAPYSNRIHADDLADAAVLIMDKGLAGAAYHVSDGNPSSMSAYFVAAAAHLGLPAPPELPLAEAKQRLSPQLWSFYDESKRLRTDALRALGWAPRYATLAQGLAHC
jgi:nucleoside-diphosphate-sugar epimerase